MKKCSSCRIEKSASEFHKYSASKTGLSAYCVDCSKEYRKNNKQRYVELSKTPTARFCDYRKGAAKRRGGIGFSLSKDEFMLFWQKPCHYCDGDIETIGLDRIDNSKGYVLGNLVPCCKVCNFAKHTLGHDEFISHCEKVVNKSERLKLKTQGESDARSGYTS